MNKKRTIMWGIIFVLAAVIIVLNQIGVFAVVGLPSLIITILLIPVIVASAMHLNFFGVFFPLAVVGIMYSETLGIQNLTPWPILFAALFLSLGLSFIFPHHKHFKTEFEEGFEKVIDEPDDSNINLIAKFSGSIKYVNTDKLETVNIYSSLGGIKVYLDHADILGDSARINFKLDFAGAELYIPKTWKVVDNVNYIIGGSEEKGPIADSIEKTIILNGKASFSGINIIHV